MILDKIVIDSSVVIKWFITQDYSLEANKILDAYKSQKLNLIAPDLIYAEVGNVLWKIQRFQGLNNQDAEIILDLLYQMQFEIFPANELLKDAYQFAVNYQRTVYDSLYVVLSIRENCKFITADEKLYNYIHGKIPNIQLIKDWI
ncbi:type II toxin-antitoxin system VapC family toxin [Okeanomitos corallinicola TIOX110]|jgi:predicted nucleic acid-binding protein|uniref:Type II toxin-antitoxin system VapC family toxin n=1 Tax=Okeanomitos corallinicola TIOX110 TaxID=3133117 RepID=A0ABZ2UTD9_9CYAN